MPFDDKTDERFSFVGRSPNTKKYRISKQSQGLAPETGRSPEWFSSLPICFNSLMLFMTLSVEVAPTAIQSQFQKNFGTSK